LYRADAIANRRGRFVSWRVELGGEGGPARGGGVDPRGPRGCNTGTRTEPVVPRRGGGLPTTSGDACAGGTGRRAEGAKAGGTGAGLPSRLLG